ARRRAPRPQPPRTSTDGLRPGPAALTGPRCACALRGEVGVGVVLEAVGRQPVPHRAEVVPHAVDVERRESGRLAFEETPHGAVAVEQPADGAVVADAAAALRGSG